MLSVFTVSKPHREIRVGQEKDRVTTSRGHVTGGNQNIDKDKLKKYGFTTLHWQMGVGWLNKTVH